MSPHQLLPFVGGLDLARGATTEFASDFSDLRNVLMLDGSLRLRPGLGTQGTVAGVDSICYLTVFQAIARIIMVTYTAATRAVDVWSTDLQGNDATLVGAWGTLDADAAAPPVFSAAESYAILVLAHDEEDVTARLDTYRFDPASIGTEWDAVEADLDGLGSAPVKFRWVTTHYGYVFAGGYGSPSEPRSDIVRQSSPVDPTVYEGNRYVGVGVVDDPVLAGRSVRGTFVVGKGQSVWAIRGSSSADFGSELIDPRVGWINHRAGWVQDGLLYFWSASGPFVCDGDSVAPGGLELDLPSVYPAGIPDDGPFRSFFALGMPDERHILFAAPDPEAATMRVYAMSVRRAGERRWAIWTMPTMLHANIITSGIEPSTLEPGYADPVTTSGTVGLSDPSVEVIATHNDAVGDETIEVWYRPAAGSWGLLTTAAINTSNPTQTLTFTGAPLVSGNYEIQVRYKRQGGKVRALYVSPDPDDWPVGSYATGTIVAVAVPTGVVVAYDFTDGSVDVTWTNGDPTQDIEVELSRTSGSGTSTATPVPGTTSQAFPWAVNNPQDRARQAGLTSNPSGSSAIRARVRHLVGGTPGAWSAYSAAVSCTYDSAPDSANVVRDDTATVLSVGLGTRYGVEITRPSSQVGNLSVSGRISANGVGGSGYGAIPANGSCGTTTDFGGGFIGFPPGGSVAVAALTLSIPTTDPNPYTVGAIPAVACGTCNLVGQQVSMGQLYVVLGWTKATHFAAHGAGFFLYLPGAVSGLVTCTA